MYTNYNEAVTRRCKYIESDGFVNWTTNINGDIIDWTADSGEVHYIYDEKGRITYRYLKDSKGNVHETKTSYSKEE